METIRRCEANAEYADVSKINLHRILGEDRCFRVSVAGNEFYYT